MSDTILGISSLFFGPPGTGKSLTAVNVALATVELWQEELNTKMIAIESNHLDYNFNYLKHKIYNCFLKYFLNEIKNNYKDLKKTKLNNLLKYSLRNKRLSVYSQTGIRTHRKEIKKAPNLDFYGLMQAYFLKSHSYSGLERFELEYAYLFYACYLDNMIASNLPIYDKRTKLMSTVINYDWFKYSVTTKTNRQILPYHIYIIDEADKEFPSSVRTSKEEKNSGHSSALASGFSDVMKMFRHMTYNKGSMIFIAQIPSSLHFQIRANCESFIQFTKHKKDIMPTITTKIIYSFVKFFRKHSINNYNKYQRKITRVKETATSYNSIEKKNTINYFSVSSLKKLNRWDNLFNKMNDNIRQFKLFPCFYDNVELTKGKKKSMIINCKDISNSYDSAFFFKRHIKSVLTSEDKAISRKFWSNLSPDTKDLLLVNSKFYDSFFQFKKRETKKEETKSKKKERKKIIKKEEKKEETEQQYNDSDLWF